jgi:peptide/nickel transport system permease protein
LPVVTLVILIVPYIARMMRGATIEALESEYAEYAILRGVSTRRLLFVHTIPNAIAPTIQAVALSLLYLAGGVVVVEEVFAYPGLGWGLIDAVNGRDVPVVQFTVVLLAAFYVVVNIVADICTLLVTPRMRTARR